MNRQWRFINFLGIPLALIIIGILVSRLISPILGVSLAALYAPILLISTSYAISESWKRSSTGIRICFGIAILTFIFLTVVSGMIWWTLFTAGIQHNGWADLQSVAMLLFSLLIAAGIGVPWAIYEIIQKIRRK